MTDKQKKLPPRLVFHAGRKTVAPIRHSLPPENPGQLTKVLAELELSRARYVELYDSAPVGYLTLGSLGAIQEINLAGAELLGFHRPDLLKVPLVTCLAKKECRKFLPFLKRIRQYGGRTSVELELRNRRDGGPIFVEMIVIPSLFKNEAARCFQCALIDITARRLAEAGVRESEQRFRNMADNAPVLIWMTDTAGQCTWFNRRWLDFAGRSMAQEAGVEWLGGVHPDDREHCRKIFGRAFAACKPVQLEYRLRRADDKYRHMLDHAQPMYSETRQFIGYIGSCVDITDRKEMEQELKQARDEAESASRAKDDFLAVLSHELRTPLNPVLLLASESAGNPELPPRVRTDFDSIRKNVELEARLIDDMLDLTRITLGKLALEKKPADVHAVLHDAVATVRAEIEHKEISLTLKLKAREGEIFGDSTRLQQIFWNVLKNAVKFTPARGEIHIETRTLPGKKILVTVRDTGIGMPPEECENIFNAFRQGAHRFGGLGLGLAISRALVQMHGGDIGAVSRGKGLGATFTIRLPAIKAAEKTRSADPVAVPAVTLPAARHAAHARILLVEDHDATRMALTQLLLRRRFKVTSAASLSEARSLLDGHAGSFDVLISDIGLPDGSGCELMQELKKETGLKGIALTGFGMEQDVSRSYDAGFLLHLTKPINIEALDNALAAVMSKG